MIGLEGKELSSARLTYRLIRADDAPWYRIMVQDATVTEPAGFSAIREEAAFQEFFGGLMQANCGVAILLRDIPIGYVRPFRERMDEPEFQDRLCIGLGFVIGGPYQRQGYGTEMLRFITDYLKQQFPGALLVADAFTDNPASNRVIQKCGYRYLSDYTMYFDSLGREKTCHSYIF